MKPVVCVDLDGVLAKYDGWQGITFIGEPIPGAVEFTKDLGQFATVIIYTTRTKEYPNNTPAPPGAESVDRRPVHDLMLIVKDWLSRHGFYWDEIYIGQGKPFFHAIIDDRAVPCRPQEFKERPDFQYTLALAHARALCTKKDNISVLLADHLQQQEEQRHTGT